MKLIQWVFLLLSGLPHGPSSQQLLATIVIIKLNFYVHVNNRWLMRAIVSAIKSDFAGVDQRFVTPKIMKFRLWFFFKFYYLVILVGVSFL